jgi:hypothetical protein
MISLLVYHLYSKKEYESKTRKEVEYLISEKVRNGLLDLEMYSKIRRAAWMEVNHQFIDDLKD